MLMQKPTEEMINEWKEIYNQNKDKLQPNKKDGNEIVNYLESHYTVKEILNDNFEKAVIDNIKLNDFYANKLNKNLNNNPIVRLFKLENVGNNRVLYYKQDKEFKGVDIIVGIELKTSYIQVEGSSLLYDELVAYTGLDEDDLKNYFLVAQYIKCKGK
ncbi:MAG: hypothetical protein Q4G09_00780 [Clostridia bacterium]|nr:hypothetical protein [Clostridia bacterium]